jgi:hypothetical protein
MRNRAYRRHKANSKMWRRLKEDRNQHYEDLNCPCWHSKKAMSFFKEQPKHCGKPCCANPRKVSDSKTECLTMQERRAADAALAGLLEN